MNWKIARDIAIIAAAGIVTGATAKYANIPTRVSVLEAQFSSIDKKLDQIIAFKR